MFPLSLFKPNHFQLFIFLATILFSQVVSATQMGHQWTGTYTGSTVIISLNPALPRVGESFTIVVSGTWRNPCIDWSEDVELRVSGQTINITSWRNYDSLDCGGEDEPKPFTRSIVIPSSAWDSLDDKRNFEVRLNLAHALNVFHFWHRSFDLSWGLHEIPPQIGQGHWISDQRPFQGLNIEQQGDTVIVYELGYRGDDGEPSWLMGDARFHGDVTHGVTYYVRWLNPTDEWDDETRYFIQPKEDEMSFTKNSFGIEVEGVNRIKAFLHIPTVVKTYKRYVFRLADNQLPVVVPDMAGQWNLFAFDNQNLEASFLIEFRAATKSEKGEGWYRFNSIDDQWVLDCWANFDGVGSCNLINEDSGITMDYDLLDFNGNYAKAPFVNSNSIEPTLTGILLRGGFHLPVLDRE